MQEIQKLSRQIFSIKAEVQPLKAGKNHTVPFFILSRFLYKQFLSIKNFEKQI